MSNYVVACTSVLPYSDDGASGDGILISCVRNESDAVEKALIFMKKHLSRINTEPFRQNIKVLCETKILTFKELEHVHKNFVNELTNCASEDPFYSNPNIIHTMVIKQINTDTPVTPYFSGDTCLR